MRLISLEHSKAAVQADFAWHGAVVAALAMALGFGAPAEQWASMLLTVLAGLAIWTLLEYLLHRFVLHGLPPFRRWHAEHHRRPAAHIGTPTTVTTVLFAGLVFLPAWLLGGLWRACALTLGSIGGYLAYSAVHHAIHHARPGNAWLDRRKHWHAQHHQPDGRCFGVTSGFWDHIFRSHGTPPPKSPSPDKVSQRTDRDAPRGYKQRTHQGAR